MLRRLLGVPFSEVLDEWTPEFFFLVLRRLARDADAGSPTAGTGGAVTGEDEDGDWETVPLERFYGSFGTG